MCISPICHNVSEYDGYKTTRYKTIRTGIGRILDSVDECVLEKIDKKIEELDIDIDYCCEHPDVMCSILKVTYGKYYVEMIRNACDD